MRTIAQPINRGMSSRSNQIRRAGGSASRATELVCVVDDDQSVRRGLRRVFEVLRFVIMELLNKQIAAEMDTAEKTIKVHRGRVMQKLGATSVPDLVRISQRAGILPARNSA